MASVVPSMTSATEDSPVISILTGDEEETQFQVLNDDGDATAPVTRQIRGKFLLLDFGGRWCPHCVTFGPKVASVWPGWKEQLKADGVDAEVILVSCDKNDEQFVEHLGVLPKGTFGINFADKKVKKLQGIFGINGFPSCVLIDDRGEVITKEGRTYVGMNKLVRSAYDLSLLGILTGQSKELGKDETDLVRVDDSGTKTLGKQELVAAFDDSTNVLVVHGTFEHPQLKALTMPLVKSAKLLAMCSNEIPQGLKVVWVDIAQKLGMAVDDEEEVRKELGGGVFCVPSNHEGRTNMLADSIGFNGRYPAGARLFGPKGAVLIDDAEDLLKRFSPNNIAIAAKQFPWTRTITSLHAVVSAEERNRGTAAALQVSQVAEAQYVFLIMVEASTDEKGLNKIMENLQDLSQKAGTKNIIAIIIGLDSESAVSATDLNKIFRGGAVHISNDERGLLRALMFWNGVKFPSLEDGSPTTIVFKGADGTALIKPNMPSVSFFDGKFESLFTGKPLERFPWPALQEAGGESEVQTKAGDRMSISELLARLKAEGKMLGLLFSGSWCYWCRDFRPKLVKVYNDYLDTDQAFEVLFISADRDEDAFVEFWKQMPWLALSYTDRDAAENIGEAYGVGGYPSFVLVDGDGNVVDDDAGDPIRNDKYPTMTTSTESFSIDDQRFLQLIPGGFQQRSRMQQVGTVKIAAAAAWENGALHAAIETHSSSISLWHSDHTKEPGVGNETTTILQAHESNIMCIALSDDGEFMATSGDDGGLKFWRTSVLCSNIPPTGKAKAALMSEFKNEGEGDQGICKMIFLGKGAWLSFVAVRESGAIFIGELRDGVFEEKESKGLDIQDFDRHAFTMFFLESQQDYDDELIVLDKVKLNRDIPGIERGWYFAYGSSSGDFSLKLHCLDEDVPPKELKSHGPPKFPQKMAKNPIRLLGHEQNVTACTYATVLEPQFDGRYPYVITGSHDKTIRVWSCINWGCKFTLRGHEDMIEDIIVPTAADSTKNGSEDGSSSSQDISVAMWMLSIDSKGVVLIWSARIWSVLRKIDYSQFEIHDGATLTIKGVDICHSPLVPSQLFLGISDGSFRLVNLESKTNVNVHSRSPPSEKHTLRQSVEVPTLKQQLKSNVVGDQEFCLKTKEGGQQDIEIKQRGTRCLLSSEDKKHLFTVNFVEYRGSQHAKLSRMNLNTTRSTASDLNMEWRIPIDFQQDEGTFNLLNISDTWCEIFMTHPVNYNVTSKCIMRASRHQLCCVSWSNKYPAQVGIRILGCDDTQETVIDMDTVRSEGEQTIPLAAAFYWRKSNREKNGTNRLIAFSVDVKRESDDGAPDGAAYILIEESGKKKIYPTKSDAKGHRVLSLEWIADDFLCLFLGEGPSGRVRIVDGKNFTTSREIAVSADLTFLPESHHSRLPVTIHPSKNGRWIALFSSAGKFTSAGRMADGIVGSGSLLVESTVLPYSGLSKNSVSCAAFRPKDGSAQIAIAYEDKPDISIRDLEKAHGVVLRSSTRESNLKMTFTDDHLVVEKFEPTKRTYRFVCYDVESTSIIYQFTSHETDPCHSLIPVPEKEVIITAYNMWEGIELASLDTSFLGTQPPVSTLISHLHKDMDLISRKQLTGKMWSKTKHLLSQYPSLAMEMGRGWRNNLQKKQKKRPEEKSRSLKRQSSSTLSRLSSTKLVGGRSEQQILDYFKRLDVNENGWLTDKEIAQVFGDHALVEEVFKQFDLDHNRKLEFKEFKLFYEAVSDRSESKFSQLVRFEKHIAFETDQKPLAQVVIENFVQLCDPIKSTAPELETPFGELVDWIFPPTSRLCRAQEKQRRLLLFTPVLCKGQIVASPLDLCKFLYDAERIDDELSNEEKQKREEPREKMDKNLKKVVRQILIGLANFVVSDSSDPALATLQPATLIWAFDFCKEDKMAMFAAEQILQFFPLFIDQSPSSEFDRSEIASLLQPWKWVELVRTRKNGLTRLAIDIFLESIPTYFGIERSTTVVEKLAFPYIHYQEESGTGRKRKNELSMMQIKEGSTLYEHRYLALRLKPYNERNTNQNTRTGVSSGLELLTAMLDVKSSVGRVTLFDGDMPELVVEFLWVKRCKTYYSVLFILHILLTLAFTASKMHEVNWRSDGNTHSLFICQLIIVCTSGIFLLIEVVTFFANAGTGTNSDDAIRKILNSAARYFSDVWNYIDISCIALTLLSTVPEMINDEDPGSVSRMIGSVALILLWVRVLYFLRAYHFTGPLVFMIVYVILHLKDFLLIVIVVCAGFTYGFRHLMQGIREGSETDDGEDGSGYSSVLYVIRTLYFTSLGDLNTAPFALLGQKGEGLANILYSVYVLFVTIVLLNLLIGIIGENYGTALQESRARWRCEQAQIILDILNTLKFFYSSDESEFFVHEFQTKSDLEDDDGASSLSPEPPSASASSSAISLDDDDNDSSEGGGGLADKGNHAMTKKIAELLEKVHEQTVSNSAMGVAEDETPFEECAIKIKYSEPVTHKSIVLRPVECMLRSDEYFAKESFCCVNCGRSRTSMEEDAIYYADRDGLQKVKFIAKECKVPALCFYCARLPEELRIGPVKEDDTTLELMTRNPYGRGIPNCDVCGRIPFKEPTDDPETDDCVIWHGRVDGSAYDKCGPCGYKWLQEKAKEE